MMAFNLLTSLLIACSSRVSSVERSPRFDARWPLLPPRHRRLYSTPVWPSLAGSSQLVKQKSKRGKLKGKEVARICSSFETGHPSCLHLRAFSFVAQPGASHAAHTERSFNKSSDSGSALRLIDNSLQSECPSVFRPTKRLGGILMAFGLLHALPATYAHHNPLRDPHILFETMPSRPSIPSITTAYIYWFYNQPEGPNREKNALRKLTPAQVQEITSKGYTLDDVVLWANIVTSRDPFVPSSQAHHLIETSANSSCSKPPIPIFPLLFYLLRPRVSNATVLLLTKYFKSRIDHEQRSYNSSPGAILPPQQGLLHAGTTFTIFSRLLRLARQTCPGAITEISSIISIFISSVAQRTLSSQSKPLKRRLLLSRLTSRCNDSLSQLAIPVKSEPFGTATIRSAAQFSILGTMARFSPPILITVTGYRAVVSVQLQRPKTKQEQDWVAMQARSWPPWKEDRSGLDSDKTVNYGLSRTIRVVNSMIQAGYASRNWTELAVMYGGWDTDGTPLTQTRRMLPSTEAETPEEQEIRRWIVRIECTRTLREAWAMFERFLRSEGFRNLPHMSPALSDIYQAVFRKIIASRRPQLPLRGPVHLPLPGDGLEVFLDSVYDHEVIEVHSEPPTVEKLVEDLLYSGVQPSPSLIAFLIQNASSGAQLNWFFKTFFPSMQQDLFHTGKDREISQILGPYRRPFIHFLCHWKMRASESAYFTGPMFSSIIPSWRILRYHPSIHAIHLAAFSPSMDDELLILLTRSLALRSSRNLFLVPQGVPSEVQAVVVFHLVRSLVDTHAEKLNFLSGQALVYLSLAGAKAARAGRVVAEWLPSVVGSSNPPLVSNAVMGIRHEMHWLSLCAAEYLLKKLCQFLGIAQHLNSQPSSPSFSTPASRILSDCNLSSDSFAAVPPVFVLHNLVRTLGILGDLGRLAGLVDFISNHAHLWESKKLRKLVVAIGYFTECTPPMMASPIVYKEGEGRIEKVNASKKQDVFAHDHNLTRKEVGNENGGKAGGEKGDGIKEKRKGDTNSAIRKEDWNELDGFERGSIPVDELRQRIKRAIEKNESRWGSWPNEQELVEYDSYHWPCKDSQS